MTGSNRRPPQCHCGALPAELMPRAFRASSRPGSPARRSDVPWGGGEVNGIAGTVREATRSGGGAVRHGKTGAQIEKYNEWIVTFIRPDLMKWLAPPRTS